MDRDVIEQKIESLRRCVARVRQKCPATAEIMKSSTGRSLTQSPRDTWKISPNLHALSPTLLEFEPSWNETR